MRRFHRLSIDEPTRDTTEKILIGLSPRLEKFHNVMIDTAAMTAAVELSARYIHDKKNPDKSIDLLDGACARQRVRDAGTVSITPDMIMAQVSQRGRCAHGSPAEQQQQKDPGTGKQHQTTTAWPGCRGGCCAGTCVCEFRWHRQWSQTHGIILVPGTHWHRQDRTGQAFKPASWT
jgi:hypothetical protein